MYVNDIDRNAERDAERNAQTEPVCMRACVCASLSPVRAHSGHVFSPIDHRTIAGAGSARICSRILRDAMRRCAGAPVMPCAAECDRQPSARATPVRIDVIIQNYIVDASARSKHRDRMGILASCVCSHAGSRDKRGASNCYHD